MMKIWVALVLMALYCSGCSNGKSQEGRIRDLEEENSRLESVIAKDNMRLIESRDAIAELRQASYSEKLKLKSELVALQKENAKLRTLLKPPKPKKYEPDKTRAMKMADTAAKDRTGKETYLVDSTYLSVKYVGEISPGRHEYRVERDCKLKHLVPSTADRSGFLTVYYVGRYVANVTHRTTGYRGWRTKFEIYNFAISTK